MIRKPVVLLAVVVAVLLLAGPSFAGITGTAHTATVGGRDGCSTCHLPHNALGKRLWPASMTAQEGSYGAVGALCFYCHGTLGGAGLPSAAQTHAMDATGDAALSHGRDLIDLPSAGDALDSTLPYGGIASGSFECTTCHNVHDDTNRPFLQDDIDVLCARCHDNRQFVGGTASATQGDWGANYGSANDGSHPVGDDVYQDGGADSPITIAAVFRTAYGATNGGHNLGGHLTNGETTAGANSAGGITCVTCHAVHGSRADADPPVVDDGTPPVVNLLVIEQSVSSVGGKSVANGGAGLDDNNALCEGCHISPAGTIDANTELAYVGLGLDPNPGATNYSHPADDIGASGTAGVPEFPALWPTAKTAGINVSPAPLCESCHTPHPAANVARTTITAASGTPILRASLASICNQCHFTGLDAGRHHPSNIAMDRMTDADITSDTTLTCDDCHEVGAHNWGAGAGFGGVNFDPQWEPANNGRDTEANERVTAGASKECEDCHYAGVATLRSPTNNQEDGGLAVTHAYRTDSEDYDDVGEGTHYLGDSTATWYDTGSVGASPFDAITDTWTAANGGGDGWSRFDGSTGHVVCESCHELEPDKNVAGTALLLQFYNDGGQSTDNSDNDPSGLCEGCHGVTPGGGSPHPMTGGAVAVTVGNPTGHTLNTTTAGVIRSPIIGNVTFPGANEMNCDSCHQPHDADSDSGTYILDSILTDVTATGALVGDSQTPENFQVTGATGLSFSTFCANCHDYL